MDQVIGGTFSQMDLVMVKFILLTPNRLSFQYAVCITTGEFMLAR